MPVFSETSVFAPKTLENAAQPSRHLDSAIELQSRLNARLHEAHNLLDRALGNEPRISPPEAPAPLASPEAVPVVYDLLNLSRENLDMTTRLVERLATL